MVRPFFSGAEICAQRGGNLVRGPLREFAEVFASGLSESRADGSVALWVAVGRIPDGF